MADRPRRKYAPRLPPAERREQVLDAALAALHGRSLDDLSMESVAAQAGIAKPVIYSVFATRDDMIVSLLGREHERGLTQIEAALPLSVSGHADAVTAYTRTVDAFIRAVVAAPERWRLILTVPEHAPHQYRDDLRKGRRAVLDRTKSLAMSIADEAPGPGDLDPVLLGHAMLSIAEMLGRISIASPDRYTPAELTAFATELARRTLQPARP
ncbi:TetR/AcrR family transcriptional regulator [Tsukamurella soli]|uniref:TetR/AcrR family transcriptional regulator n=1 Tax=Tsukamurella soli TaxID=644556 RepID=A0ABP8K8Z2_9ACTN